MRDRGPIYSLRWSRGYSITTSVICVLSILLHWIKLSYNQGWRIIEHVLLLHGGMQMVVEPLRGAERWEVAPTGPYDRWCLPPSSRSLAHMS